MLSLIVVYGQLLVTGTVVKVSSQDSAEVEKRFKKMRENSIARRFLYGDPAPLPAPEVCRWAYQDLGEGLKEYPPRVECNPDRLDVALRTDNPETFDVKPYYELFEGNTERIHICKTCQPDLVIHAYDGEKTKTDIYSVQGMMLLGLTDFNENVTTERLEVALTFDKTMELIGSRRLHSHGYDQPIKFSGISTNVAFICSIAFLVIMTLWLALKAHRKVLDYFSRNGALLPMVAATGKKDFYAAIWYLTLFRVGAFLAAAVPLTILTFIDLDKKGRLGDLFSGGEFSFLVWIVALIASMALATMVASIADLKHRHQFLSFTYKYIPLIVCVLGALVWAFTFLVDGAGASMIRNVAASLPIVGVAPILIAPIFKPQMLVLIIHSVLTLGLFVVLVRHNSQWFAAHLEDL
jgi:hypothetical protein